MPFSHQAITNRQAAGIIFAMAIVQLVLQLSLLTRGVEYVAASLTIDDTFYYLQTAWNTKLLGFVTFDGLHSTNGVQFLWFVVILAIAWLAQTKTALLVATLAVTFLLNGLCYLIIWRIGVLLQRLPLAIVIAGFWSLQSLPFRIYTMGMENSIHALIFWCAIWQCLIFLVRVSNQESPNFLVLTIVLILNAWARLDSALLSTILYVFCLLSLAQANRFDLKALWQKYAYPIAGTSLLAGVGLLTQLAAFQVMGGKFLPVSALVKTSGASRGLTQAALDMLSQVFMLGLPSIVQGRLPALGLVSLAATGILLVIWAWVTLPNRPDRQSVLFSLWSCLAVGEVIYHVYVAVSGVQYTPYFIWYRSPSFIFWTLTAALVADLMIGWAANAKFINKLARWAPLGVGLASFTVAIYMFARSINFTSQLYTVRYQAALWIAENSSPETIFAAWNTGQLSYFSDRPFINLDGVINSVDYYERVLHGSISLDTYLIENNVAYLVDYATYDTTPDFPVIQSFPINDGSGRSIQVWQVAPPVSSTQ